MEKAGQEIAGVKSKESVRRALEMLAEQAYEEVAAEYGEDFTKNPKDIYWQAACQQFSTSLWALLKKRGVRSQYKSLEVKLIKPGVRHHMILETDDYLIDGTWQQLEDGPPHPDNRCLILRKKALEEDLEKARVPRKFWFLYTGGRPESK